MMASQVAKLDKKVERLEALGRAIEHFCACGLGLTVPSLLHEELLTEEENSLYYPTAPGMEEATLQAKIDGLVKILERESDHVERKANMLSSLLVLSS